MQNGTHAAYFMDMGDHEVQIHISNRIQININ